LLLRVWSGAAGESNDKEEWHGKIQHAVTGHVRYFDTWLEFAEILRSMVYGR
jgi:hypothetical protein